MVSEHDVLHDMPLIEWMEIPKSLICEWHIKRYSILIIIWAYRFLNSMYDAYKACRCRFNEKY